MAPGRAAARAAQSLRTSQQPVIQRRVQQVRQALQNQQRTLAAGRVAQQRQQAQQRREAQQRRAATTPRARVRTSQLQQQLSVLREQQDRFRIWQRTAAKRAARQVETEQAILDRERRIADYERERETYEEYVRRGHRAARAASELALTRTEALAGLLRTVVAQPLQVSFAELKRRDVVEPFDAGGLDRPLPAPRAEEFEPSAVRLPGWVPGQRAARDRALAAADEAYRQADVEYRAAEVERVRKLSAAKLDHQRRVREASAKIREYNVAVDRLEIGYRARERVAVERYTQLVLSRRGWPAGMRVSWRLRYLRAERQLDVECVLPGPDVVPSVRRYRYAAASDAFRRQAVPTEEIRARYAAVVHQSVLCALADLFGALSADVVDVIALNARVDAVSPSGRPIRPHVVSIATARAEWAALRLVGADPAQLLRQLDARVSPDPYAAVGIEPWADFDG
jgi:restriction system protein